MKILRIVPILLENSLKTSLENILTVDISISNPYNVSTAHKTILSIKDNEKIEILQLIRVVNNTFSYEIIVFETSI